MKPNIVERPRYAPILLLPVEMIRKSVSKGYIIRARDEESMLNITLLGDVETKTLASLFLGSISLPKDENGTDVKTYFLNLAESCDERKALGRRRTGYFGYFFIQ